MYARAMFFSIGLLLEFIWTLPRYLKPKSAPMVPSRGNRFWHYLTDWFSCYHGAHPMIAWEPVCQSQSQSQRYFTMLFSQVRSFFLYRLLCVSRTELDTWPGFAERIRSAGGILGWRALWKWNAMSGRSGNIYNRPTPTVGQCVWRTDAVAITYIAFLHWRNTGSCYKTRGMILLF